MTEFWVELGLLNGSWSCPFYLCWSLRHLNVRIWVNWHILLYESDWLKVLRARNRVGGRKDVFRRVNWKLVKRGLKWLTVSSFFFLRRFIWSETTRGPSLYFAESSLLLLFDSMGFLTAPLLLRHLKVRHVSLQLIFTLKRLLEFQALVLGIQLMYFDDSDAFFKDISHGALVMDDRVDGLLWNCQSHKPSLAVVGCSSRPLVCLSTRLVRETSMAHCGKYFIC